MLAQQHRRWPSITSALGQRIVLHGVSEILKRHQHNRAFRKHGKITEYSFNDGPASKTVVNIETSLVECHVFAQSIQQIR